MDGSAEPFVEAFLKSGIETLTSLQKYFLVKIVSNSVRESNSIRVDPARRSKISCRIDFDHELIGTQSLEYLPSVDNFVNVARARTFCHLKDVNYMKEKGLALGGSLENAIVISDEGLLNSEGLRSKMEFVEHKLLDLIGDVALLGAPLIGEISASRPGHALHAEFTKALLESGSLEEYYFSEPARVNEYPAEILSPAFASLG